MKKLLLLLPIAVMLLLPGCRDHDDPAPGNEEELITTLRLSFVDQNSPGAPIVFEWKDSDGTGPGSAVIDPIELNAHTTYQMFVTVSDDSKTPAVDITEEIEEESTAHQFFFVAQGILIGVSYDDVDSEGRPLGLANIVSVDHESTGSLTVVLRHNPNKDAAGVASGEITNAGGDTDIEVTFPVTVNED
jgi:hypothetical protein